MYEALAEAVERAVRDDAVRVLLLRGQPGSFTAGYDLEDLLAHPPAGDTAPVFGFMRALMGCEKPVVAAVGGSAVGIGTTLLLHCDLVYVSEQARFALPFVALGVVPEFASSFLLPRLIGMARAAEKLLLGEPFSAAEAVQLGLATALFPDGELTQRAAAIAERLTQLPQEALRTTKRLLRAPLAPAVEQALLAESAAFVERLASPEAREALRAFAARRRSAAARG